MTDVQAGEVAQNNTNATTQAETKPETTEIPAAASDGKQTEQEKVTAEKVVEKPVEVKAEQKPVEQKSVVPEKYELKLPEGSQLNAERLEKISQFAKEKGLSQEAAQGLVEEESAAVGEFYASNVKNYEAQVASWADEAKKDPEIGGNNLTETVRLAQAGMKQVASPKLIQLIDSVGFGNHPEVIKMFAKIGSAMQNDKLVKGNLSAVSRIPLEEKFYGSQTKKG